MGAEEEQGFVIRDRRSRSEGGEPAAAAPSSPDSGRPAGAAAEAPPSQEPHLPVTFSSFVFSLGTSALMLMGEQLDARQGAMPVNLPQAKEIIDILSVLETKTRGNLSAEEQSVLQEMLYALRMKYVALASANPAAPSK
jgi:hypothetical protein